MAKRKGEPKPVSWLSEAELNAIRAQPIYEPGRAYLWVLTYGWAIVGYFVDRPEPLVMRVAHGNHFRSAGKDYGRLSQEGDTGETQWRYEGTTLIYVPQIHHVDHYHGIVPHERIEGRE